MAARKRIKVNADEPEEVPALGDELEQATEFQPPSEGEAPLDPPPQETETDENIDEKLEEATEDEKLALRVAELEDRLLRSQADFDNYRKRTAQQFETISQTANERLLLEILEIVDNFERAFEHADGDVELDAIKKGVKLIHSQMTDLLAKHDVTPIEALGQPFDPQLHEALMQVASAEYDEGVVALELGRGYRLGQRVLRYSKVGVSTGKADTPVSDD